MPSLAGRRTLLALTCALAVTGTAGWAFGAPAPAASSGAYSQLQETALSGGGGGPTALAIASDGYVWLTGGRPDTPLACWGSGGQVTSYTAGLTGTPGALGADASGDVWFTESDVHNPPGSPAGTPNSGIGVITPSGSITQFQSGLVQGDQLSSIALGPDGNMWFTIANGGAGAIGRITPWGTITRFTSAALAGAQPGAITGGPDGNVWFTLNGGPLGDTGGIGQISRPER